MYFLASAVGGTSCSIFANIASVFIWFMAHLQVRLYFLANPPPTTQCALAERLGIPRVGTLGILRRAKKANLIHEIKSYIQLLRINGIYIHDSLIKAILRDVGEV